MIRTCPPSTNQFILKLGSNWQNLLRVEKSVDSEIYKNIYKPDQEFHINIEQNVTIKQVQNFKYLGVSFNKKGVISKDVVNQICKGRQIIGCLISLWWDKNISLDTQKSD